MNSILKNQLPTATVLQPYSYTIDEIKALLIDSINRAGLMGWIGTAARVVGNMIVDAEKSEDAAALVAFQGVFQRLGQLEQIQLLLKRFQPDEYYEQLFYSDRGGYFDFAIYTLVENGESEVEDWLANLAKGLGNIQAHQVLKKRWWSQRNRNFNELVNIVYRFEEQRLEDALAKKQRELGN